MRAGRGGEIAGVVAAEELAARALAAGGPLASAGMAASLPIARAGAASLIGGVDAVEAVGQRWWPVYLDCIARNLKPGGRAALQFISMRHEIFANYARSPDFIQTYIFPGGLLLDEPAFAALAIERGLSWQDREEFRLDYAETLKRWRDRYDDAVTRGDLDEFGESFHQLWRYYLMYCEGGFRGGAIDVADNVPRGTRFVIELPC